MSLYSIHIFCLYLGGKACHTPLLTQTKIATLSHLPLAKLSARNCKIKEIDRKFLQNFRQTLKKLDLSCNQLKDSLVEITDGVAYSQLDTLILDHINKDGSYCPWNNVTDIELNPLGTVPLRVLSLRANQITAQSKLNLKDFCPHLLYLDLSLNKFSESARYIARTFRGEEVSNVNKDDLLQFTDIIPVSIRYLALEGVTGNLKCGGLNEDLLNCDDDSVHFENKTSLSSHLSEPLIMKFPLLLAIMTRHKDIFSYCQMLRICNLDITTGLIVVNANSREHQRSKTSYIYTA